MLLIAGPCLLESLEICQTVAAELVKLQRQHASKLDVVFKGSFDKANRTDVHSPRGLGISRGIEILKKIKQNFSLKITTDIHLPEQAKEVSAVCDVIQIPAFLCRQTDLLKAAAETNRIVSVKKGQFLSPFDMRFIVEKLRYFHAKEILLIERGSTFGYGSLVVDMRTFPIMKRNGCLVLFDATHSLQMPGFGEDVTGGDRRYLQDLVQAALAAGANGLFLETHPVPETALSDKATQLPLGKLSGLIKNALTIWETVRDFKENR